MELGDGNLNRKFNLSLLAVLAGAMIVAIICSTLFSGLVFGQQFTQQSGTSGSAATGPILQGLEGLKGFGSGHSQLSLAIIPLSQQNSQLAFQVVGFAVSVPETGEAVVYALKTPVQGVIDPSQNTLQIDISSIGDAVSNAGYIDSSEIYETMRTDPRVVVVDLDLTNPTTSGSQTIFSVNSVDIVPPDGRMQAFSLQQPTQLILDTQSGRIAMVSFPEMTSALDSYYGEEYSNVEPVVYAQPVPVVAPVFVPYLQPIPFFGVTFATFNPFYFGYGWRPFYEWNRFTNRDFFSDRNQFPIRQPKNDFADRARSDLVTGQKKGEFDQRRNVGANVQGGIGGYKGGVKTSMGTMGTKVGKGVGGGMKAGGGVKMGGGRR